ncbi:hypothetical protein [Tepidanaerobacter syntrophicus]|uniref:hypothetical protein n=1 Tax=Tepidanaerobacter syntrophicus TaxID=224999 RepID=UPI001BD543EF|nr:hypothetical protein [Tepidanaerobacter syntrophicus]
MTIQELYTKLTSTGLPVAYGSFTAPKKPPFITYQFANSNDFIADSKNYADIARWRVELYTADKDISSESKVEQALSDFVYTKAEYWIDEEKMFQIVYEFETIMEV